MNAFEIAVAMAGEALADEPGIYALAMEGTDVNLIRDCLQSLVFEGNADAAFFQLAALDTVDNWDQASQAEQVAICAFLDVVAPMVLAGLIRTDSTFQGLS